MSTLAIPILQRTRLILELRPRDNISDALRRPVASRPSNQIQVVCTMHIPVGVHKFVL